MRGSEPDVNVVLDVPAGAQEVTVILELRPEDDRFAEGTEIFEVRVVMEGLVPAGTLTLMIDDDDEAGLVFTDLNGNPVPLAGLRVAEGQTTLYRLGLSSQPEFNPVGIKLSVTGEGSELIQLSEGSNDPDDALTLFFIPDSDRLFLGPVAEDRDDLGGRRRQQERCAGAEDRARNRVWFSGGL